MKLNIGKDRFKTTILVFFIWILAYFGTKFLNNFLNAKNNIIYIFPFESNIPYLPELFPIYFLAVPLAVLPAFIIKSRKLFNKTIIVYLTTIVITGIIFLLYPTKITRPLVTDIGIYHETIKFFYSIIPAYNLFPSFHMSLLVLSTLFIRKENRNIGKILITSTVIIAITTLFLKEHYLIDLIAGFILSITIYKILVK